jgi:predicted transcriptional regulator
MKKVTLSVFALSLVFLTSGCGDSLDSCMKDTLKLQNEYAEILEGVKEKGDVDKAKSKIEALQKKAKDIGERMKKQLKDVKGEEALKKMLEAAKKYEEDGKKADERMNKAKESVRKAIGEFPKDLEFKPPTPD